MATRVTRESLLEDVAACASVIAEWETRGDRARSELAAAEDASGEALVSRPSLLDKLAKQMQTARDEIAMSGRALDAARARAEQARRRVLEFDAVEFDRVAAGIESDLAKHRARTDELLALLEEHECVFVPEWKWARAEGQAWRSTGPQEWSAPKSDRLEAALGLARLRADVLRDVAAGVDPAGRITKAAGIESTVFGVPLLDVYPASVWGPEAVVPAPAFLSTIEHARQLLRDLDEQVASKRADIAEKELELAELAQEVRVSRPGRESVLDDPTPVRDDGWLLEQQAKAKRWRNQIVLLSAWIEDEEPIERARLEADLESVMCERGQLLGTDPAAELVAS